jgi:hypothetical protein
MVEISSRPRTRVGRPRHPEPTQSSGKNVYQTLMARNVRGVQAEPYFARLVVQGTQQGQ